MILMPSDILGTVSDSLLGRSIVVGVTGSIAAVRVVDLIRDLIRRGAKVHCVMSASARQILHPYALEYASANPVITEITGRVEHVEFCGVDGTADLLLIAPATANTVGKMAQGIDDTPVTTFATTAIGSGKEVMVVPAMHEAMYRHPAVLKNLSALKEMGVKIVDPRIEEDKAKIASNQDIALNVERLLGPGDLLGKKILIISGSTAEKVDPIRILTNRASGKTGVELGLEAYRRGAEVAIIHRWKLGLPFKEIYAESAHEFLDSALQELTEGYDALISSAAIADYTLDPYEQKIKSGQDLVLKLKPTAKVVKTIRSSHPNLKIVGFKAETNVLEDELISRAKRSMRISGIDLMVANDVGKGGIGSDENRVIIIDSNEIKKVEGKKNIIARKVIDALAEILEASDISGTQMIPQVP